MELAFYILVYVFDEALILLIKYKKIDFIIHMAAQAGVRYSFINPRSYINSNINGFFNILESCQKLGIKNILFAWHQSLAEELKNFRTTFFPIV